MQINLTPDPSLLAIVVIFLLNYLIVRRFFLSPIMEIIETREREIATADSLYEAAMARFNEATTQMETQLHSAKRDAAQVREQFRTEAAAYRNQVVDRTQTEARALVSEADRRLSTDVQQARQNIAGESENLARLAAERILGRPV